MTRERLQRELETARSRAPSADASAIDALIRRIARWESDRTTPAQLMTDLDILQAGMATADGPLGEGVQRSLDAFRMQVKSLGGMTMNERLVIFGLIGAWDRGSAEERALLYAKLEAAP